MLVDAVCQQGLRYLHQPAATKANPDDEAARLNCQLGSWLSAFGLQSRVPMGASHAIGHVLGGTCDVPHFCTAVMMPSVLRQPPRDEKAQQAIAAALAAPGQDAGAGREVHRGARPAAPARRCRRWRRPLELIGKNAMLSIFTRQPAADPRAR